MAFKIHNALEGWWVLHPFLFYKWVNESLESSDEVLSGGMPGKWWLQDSCPDLPGVKRAPQGWGGQQHTLAEMYEGQTLTQGLSWWHLSLGKSGKFTFRCPGQTEESWVMKCMAQTVLSGQEEQEISVNQSGWGRSPGKCIENIQWYLKKQGII